MGDEKETPNNQSPETITEDEPVTIGEIADAVVEKLKGLIPGGTTETPTPTPTPTDSTPTPAPAPATPAPAPAPVTGALESVEATVRRIMAEKDTDTRIQAVEQKVNESPKPKPPRTGIAAALFGKERS